MNIYIPTENDIIHETSVDFVLRPCAKEIYIVQYDKSLPIIKVELYRNGERYVLPETYEANLYIAKINNNNIIKPSIGMNEERNAVYFEIDEQVTNYFGVYKPKVELIFNNKKAYSSSIILNINRNPIQNN